MALLTVHHWPDPAAGLLELRRVVSGPVLVMTFDYSAETEFWLGNYVPEMDPIQAARYPTIQQIDTALGSGCRVTPLPVRRDCTDQFMVALYAHPEAFLNAEVRASQSGWKFMPDGVEARFVDALTHDLASGVWDERYGALRTRETIRTQLRLVVSPA